MKNFTTLLAAIVLLGGCAGTRLASNYDEVIDRGITEFAEQFNTHVKNMGDLAGTPAGTYEANRGTYNALDSKLDVLIARASTASEGKGCRLEQKVFVRIKALLNDDMPPQLASDSESENGNPDGCNARLLILVKTQLTFVREIHSDSDKCGALSCLRPATAKTALRIANQSISAVSVVEAAKRH